MAFWKAVELLIFSLKPRKSFLNTGVRCYFSNILSDMTAFFNAEADAKGNRFGYLVEYDKTDIIFNTPQQTATLDYVSGRFG
ncbi:MAG: hypothetical protein F6K19_51780 [Cyanothece sp. SIO1E1]|nr:hypothetical protein [Cyanothece sp. SIO1E1]